MNKKTLWDLKAKDVNLKDVKSRSLNSERRGSQRSNKKWHGDEAQQKVWCHSAKLILYLYFCDSTFFSVSHVILIIMLTETIMDIQKGASEIEILPASKNNSFTNLRKWRLNTWVSMCENDSTNWFKNCDFWPFLFLLI